MEDRSSGSSGSSGVAARSAARLRELWAQDRPAFGLWNHLADPAVAELVAAGPFDYVCVDLQHGLAAPGQLPGLLQAMRAAGRAPVVRVPWNEPAAVMRALDAGAAAVLVPMVDSAEDAARAASACRFPPAGSRSWGPMWADALPGGAPPPAEHDAAVLCLVMVETRAGVDALEEIVRVPGVDGVYVGPNDLALGCGHGRATYRDSPEVDRLVARVVDACREAGVVAGLHCSDVEMATHWAGRGVRMLTAAQDTALLRAAAERTWRELTGAAERG
ncbi:HpcH/HpaI aldolase/citrate lyase family protein [Quadrisphaera sp. DSM 44207]|uniref:HpcH/HpaI aldolase family protein n=1 Tax=Quadrisphaera sp. DSM 44207 TaxID=1881057 RepID=UPI0008829CC9|nr:aldolase/citrate lyase family protein [Quadrisphaera sp. DSM 44207]SDQ63146.1 4-hydroxy-2-oxoheptanedioate aldolase [Quadrisphaera sp. DSM 44207]